MSMLSDFGENASEFKKGLGKLFLDLFSAKAKLHKQEDYLKQLACEKAIKEGLKHITGKKKPIKPTSSTSLLFYSETMFARDSKTLAKKEFNKAQKLSPLYFEKRMQNILHDPKFSQQADMIKQLTSPKVMRPVTPPTKPEEKMGRKFRRG